MPAPKARLQDRLRRCAAKNLHARGPAAVTTVVNGMAPVGRA